MASAVVAFLLLEEERAKRVARKILRDCNNPLELPTTVHFLLDAFRMVLDAINGKLSHSEVLPILQLDASLRFLSEGSYQRSAGNDLSISLCRSTVSTILRDVLKVMERFICPQGVQQEMSSKEKRR